METQYISLNMTPTGVNPCFHISQYDVGRMLGFIVHSGGATVDLDTYTCTIEATRSDGTAITSAVATTDNIGTFEVTPTMSNKADKYRCQLIIVDENSKRIASLPFDMEVTKAAMDENSEAIEEDASLYQQYTEAVQGAIAEANADIQAEENARIAAVNAEATARQNADATLQNNIDAEATARQTADNTLQGNINSEASTRASADSNLQSQINQIVAPSGEAPSAAEVQNARIGAGGVTYNTLGDAIRGQVSDLKSALKQDSNYIHSISTTETEVTEDMSGSILNKSFRADGTIYDMIGFEYKVFTYLGGKVTTICNDRGNCHVAFLDKDMTVIPNSGYTWWMPANFTIPNGTVFFTVTVNISTGGSTTITQTIPNSEKVNAVDEVSVSPKNRNGTRPNPGNTDFITINDDGYIESKCNAVRFSVDFDVQSGYQYIWEYYVTEELPFDNRLYHDVLTDVPFVVIDTSGSKYVSMQVSRRSKADHTVYDPVRVEDVGYYSLKAVYLYENDKRVGASIIEKNNDVLPAVFAASRYGIHSGGHANTEKKYSLLVTTDVHGSVEAFKSAINYLNKTESIFAGCCLGDIVASYANENAQWYVDAVQKSDKPFFTVIGNHEKGITKDDRALSNTALLAKCITPTENKIGKTGMTTLYYSVYDTEQKMCFIILDDYDTPETKDSEGNYYVRRGAECFSQTQIDWFISELENIPSDYHLVILMHSFYNPNTPASCNFTQPGISIVGSTPYLYPASENIIPSIINAWKNGTSLSKTVAPESDYSSLVSSLDISCDFTSRGTGDFICYLVGHMHNDIIAHSTAFPDQLIVCLCATANDYWQNYGSDLPRIKGTKTEDAITVVGFDTSAKKVNLVRVGSNVTIDMVNRTMISLSY